MTIRMLQAWNGLHQQKIVTTLSGSDEAALVAAGIATYDLDGPAENLRMAQLATDAAIKPATYFGLYPSTTDDQTDKLNAAFAKAASDGVAILMDAGQYRYSGLLTASCSIIGAGEHLTTFVCTSANGDNSRIDISGADLVFTGFGMWAINAAAQGGETAVGLRLGNVTDFSIGRLNFKNMMGAPILMRGCKRGVVHGIKMRDCWKDGVHVTKDCEDININAINAYNAGDDVVAIVGYVADGISPKRINVTNVVIDGSKSARGVAVVGAEDVVIDSIVANNCYAAGIYIASEGGFNTYANHNIQVDNFILRNCGRASSYAALQISSRASFQNSNIKIGRGSIIGSAYRAISTGGAASGLTQDLSIVDVTINDTTDPSNKNNAGAGAGAFSGAEFAYVNNLSVRGLRINETGGFGLYVSNTCTGSIAIADIDATNINKNGASSNDVVQVQASSGASRISINRIFHGPQAYTVERLVECNNPTLTVWGKTYSETGKGVITGFTDSAISVGASPYTHQNTTPSPINVSVQGGTVSAISMSRDGTTFYSQPITSGVFLLQPNERLKVTYSVAPTMTSIPSI